MNLYHYSKEQVTLDKWKQMSPTQDGDPYFKPRGLWVSADDYSPSWPEWCFGEDFMLSKLKHRHKVEVERENVLLLSTEHDIREFGNTYEYRVEWSDRIRFIDWPRVTMEWDGLLIVPYQWGCRMTDDTNWYYPWDCASGCIWNKRAILSIEEVPDNPWRDKLKEKEGV